MELGRDDSSGKRKVRWAPLRPSTTPTVAAAASDGGGDERMCILKFIKRNITVLDNMSRKKFHIVKGSIRKKMKIEMYA